MRDVTDDRDLNDLWEPLPGVDKVRLFTGDRADLYQLFATMNPIEVGYEVEDDE